MVGPYRCVNMVVKIDTITIGVVEGLDIDLQYAGGAEPIYGSRTRRHSAGSKQAKFTITRWYYTDVGREDYLLDLFNDETLFTLTGYLVDAAGVEIRDVNGALCTELVITGCRLYRWRPKTGSADDIIGEEATGEATGWTLTNFKPSTTP